MTAVNPASGPITGGTAVTITGTSLIGVTAITIGGVAATGISVVNATTIRAVTSAHGAGAASVVVTAPTGVGTGTGIYTYVSAPKVSAVNPVVGTTAGGTRITITGTAFTGARTVTIGGVAAASVTVVNTTTITAITPAHDAGAVNVAVTTPSGIDTGRYTYINTLANLALASTAAAAMQVGQNYSQTNVASGGIPAYAYTLSSGNLPAGTTLNSSTGLVSGMPTTKGAFSYTIEVTDSGEPELRAAQATAGEIMAILTTTALASSHDPSLTGQPVTLTARSANVVGRRSHLRRWYGDALHCDAAGGRGRDVYGGVCGVGRACDYCHLQWKYRARCFHVGDDGPDRERPARRDRRGDR